MSSKPIYLMALEPKPGVTFEVHAVGLPGSLQAALLELFPPKRSYYAIRSERLREELQCWFDQAVMLNPVRQGGTCGEWLMALRPIDMERFCNVVANWVICEEPSGGEEARRRVLELLEPSTFDGCVHERVIEPFDADGSPSDAAGGLAFSVFSAAVANSIAGRCFYLPGGNTLTFSRLAQGTKNEYELVSDVLWHEGSPFAIALRFSVQTLPANRRARLNVRIVVRRFVAGAWRDGIYLEKGVHALVQTEGGVWRTVPYRYSKREKRIAWDELSRRNYESSGLGKLPDIGYYFEHMTEYARGDLSPRILSPYSASSTSWAKASKVGPGVPVVDKAVIFEAISEALSGYATPVGPLEPKQLSNLRPAFDDAGKKLWVEDRNCAEATHAAWASSNRRRLAACSGEKRITFELVGAGKDHAALDAAHEEIVYFAGGAGERDGVEVRFVERDVEDLLNPLKDSGDAGTKVRWAVIEEKLGKASGLTACIVALPDADRFELGHDPKEAIRMGFARSGRLTQFLVPEGDNLEHRARSAVRDLMRQIGFTPELRRGKGGVDFSVPAVGLHVFRAPQSKMRAEFPLAVRVAAEDGAVTVESPVFGTGRLPYWKAQLELARLSTSGKEFAVVVKGADGRALKRMVERIRDESTEAETLLLVWAYGDIRRKNWWPGISDRDLAQGTLHIGPDEPGKGQRPVPFEIGESKLAILRVRSGADGEVPDYYTDSKSGGGAADEGLPHRYCRQGIYPAAGHVLALTAKPNDSGYNQSLRCSKFDRPDLRFAEKTLNEYCLLTPGGPEAELKCSRYAEALRGCMVQLAKSDMRVNLPAPLHLAEKMEEYVWLPESKPWGRRNG